MRAAVFIVVLAACMAVAEASPKPWENVPAAEQDRADALFEAGNALFARQAHGAALDKYREAATLWDHPLIRFNIAVTLIRLERFLEASAELGRALQFGAEPFEPALYHQALDYQTLLAGRVGTIEVSCTQAGARVQVDGQPWLTCPGTRRERVLAGAHALTAELAGHATWSRSAMVIGGQTVRESVSLRSVESLVRVEYPMRRAIPIAVAGGGAAVALIGLATWLSGRAQMDEFETRYAITCAMGCRNDLADQPLLARLQDGAATKGLAGAVLMTAGGIAIASGVALGVWNRPRRIVPSLDVQIGSAGGIGTASWTF